MKSTLCFFRDTFDDCVIEKSTKEESALSAIEYRRSVSRSSSKKEYKENHQNTTEVVSEPLHTVPNQTNGHSNGVDELKPIARERSLSSNQSRRSSAKSHRSTIAQQLAAGADDIDAFVKREQKYDDATPNNNTAEHCNGVSEAEKDDKEKPKLLAGRSSTKTSLQSFLLHEQEVCNDNNALG